MKKISPGKPRPGNCGTWQGINKISTHPIKTYYQDQAVADSYDRDRFASLIGRTFDRMEKRAIRKTLGCVLDTCPQSSVLDVPCGTGRITEMLLSMGLTVTGADISPRMIDVAREKCRRFADQTAFQIMDLDAPNLPENAFDLVTCVRLLHHLDSGSRTAMMRSLARLSRRWVLVNVSFSSPFYRWRRNLKRWLGQGVSKSSATWQQIKTEAAQAGLRVERRVFVRRFLSEDLILLLGKEGIDHD